MPTNVTTLRPGYLVRLSTALRGNVSYFKDTIDPAHITDSGTESETWRTNRITQDPAEQIRADAARSQARAAIMRVCTATQFGPLCPESQKAELDAAIAEARKIADTHNAGARFAMLRVYVLAGRVAPDDAEAIRSINAEMRDLLDTMRQGLADLDAEKVREAASRARAIGMMLSERAQAQVQDAIDAARAQARAIVKAGESVSLEIDRTALERIAAARTAFLDLDATGAEIAAPSEMGRGVDLDTEPQPQPSAPEAPMIDLEARPTIVAASAAQMPLFELE